MILFLPLAPNDGSSASDCLSNFATMDAIMAGLGRSVRSRDSEEEQLLIPEITFTCHGFITKWILAANWDDEDCYPELQTWNSIDGITYTKQGATTFSAEGGSEEMTFYEISPRSSMSVMFLQYSYLMSHTFRSFLRKLTVAL